MRFFNFSGFYNSVLSLSIFAFITGCDTGSNGTTFLPTSPPIIETIDGGGGSGEGTNEVTEVTTTRDSRGVWTITGPSDPAFLEETLDAMGYAVATDRLWQMELFRRNGRGKLAEIFGASFLGQDTFIRTTGYTSEEIQAGYDALPEESQSIVDGYLSGVNRRITEVVTDTSLLPLEFSALGIIPAPWTINDMFSWLATLLREFNPGTFSTRQIDNAVLVQELAGVFPATGLGMFEDLRWINDPAALTYIPNTSGLSASTSSPVSVLNGKLPETSGNLGAALEKLNQFHQDRYEKLEQINARPKWGSYAWVVDGTKTASGNPILYSGPQTGFSVPTLMSIGNIRSGGLEVSGMNIAGLPSIIVGRTPHHAWSQQVGETHAVDYYFEDPADVVLDRFETISAVGQADISVPVFKGRQGPVISPIPFDPTNYDPAIDGPIISWRYSHQGFEFDTITGGTDLSRAKSMDEFQDAVRNHGVSNYFCYADVEGNISFWMSGRDPVREAGEYRFPQPMVNPLEWDPNVVIPLINDRNNPQGYYTGWNNKAIASFDNPPLPARQYGPFHRAQVLEDIFSSASNLTYEDIRAVAENISTTDSFGAGGNPWPFVESQFTGAVMNNITPARQEALDIMATFDGHFVDGGMANWTFGQDRSDAWMLMDTWIREVVRLTFADELDLLPSRNFATHATLDLFNALIHALDGPSASIINNFDWFQNLNPLEPQTSEEIIVQGLDNALATLGARPWGTGQRGVISYNHDLFGLVSTTPFGSRSTWAQVVEIDSTGPIRSESFFALGQSGNVTPDVSFNPVFNTNFFSYAPAFNSFVHVADSLFD